MTNVNTKSTQSLGIPMLYGSEKIRDACRIVTDKITLISAPKDLILSLIVAYHVHESRAVSNNLDIFL